MDFELDPFDEGPEGQSDLWLQEKLSLQEPLDITLPGVEGDSEQVGGKDAAVAVGVAGAGMEEPGARV